MNININTMPKKYLISINPNTNEINSRYLNGKQVIKYNKGYNYNSLMNAINKKITYKGYTWLWIHTNNLDENSELDMKFRKHIFDVNNSINSILTVLGCHTTTENSDQCQDGKQIECNRNTLTVSIV